MDSNHWKNASRTRCAEPSRQREPVWWCR